MSFHAFSRLPAVLGLAFLLALSAGCSGVGGSSVAAQPSANQALLVNPTSLSFTAAGQTLTVSAQEGGYNNTFTATSSATTVATVSPGSSYNTFTVTAVAAGTATITVKDATTHSATVSVGVTTTTGGIN